ncbi:MAG: cell division protein SepF [Nitrososphaerales archaeon]
MTQSTTEKEAKETIYLKALPLKSLEELSNIKDDINKRMIIILRITPLAQRDVEELKRAVEELYEFSVSIGGDIARLGEERIVITPPGVKIWRGLT